jgi:hypothetical protein
MLVKGADPLARELLNVEETSKLFGLEPAIADESLVLP